MLEELVTAGERGEAGLADRREAAAELEPLVKTFGEELGRKAGPSHTTSVLWDVRKVLAGCRLKTVADLRAADVAVRVESFVWSLTEGDEPVSAPTAAYHGKHARQFTRWLWLKRKLLAADPLAGVELPSQKTVDARRALTAEELAKLLKTTAASDRPHRGLTGPERAVLYAVAVTNGFLVSELAALVAGHFHFDNDPPLVHLPGECTKNGEEAILPLAPAVVAELRSLAARRPTGPLFPGSWHGKAFEMFALDLADASIPERSADARLVFHSTRHTFLTMVGRAATVKVSMELDRHSTPDLTLGRYSHEELAEKAAAVASIPLGETGKVPLTRPQLEAFAALAAVLLGVVLDTLRDTPTVDSAGDSVRPPETDAGKKGRRGTKRKR